MTITRTLAALALAFAGLFGATAVASAAPIAVDKYAFEVGDDNGDGIIDEDESGWDCSTMGNLSCTPLT